MITINIFNKYFLILKKHYLLNLIINFLCNLNFYNKNCQKKARDSIIYFKV